MWNNGNQNNGNWNNGPQNYGQQDPYAVGDTARERGGARFPFVEGSGTYAVAQLEEFPHSTDGVSARALLKVLASKDGKHPVGSFVVKIWKLVKPPKFPNALTEGEEFVDFCRKLKGAPAGYAMGQDMRTLMKPAPVGRAAEQLARGTVIECVAVPNKKGTWINVYWNHVQQSPQDIAAMRQRLEAEGIPSTGPQSQGTQGGQYQGAPHPSQMQGQYPAQNQGSMPQQQSPYSPQQYAQQQPQQPQQPQQQYAQPAPQGGFLGQATPGGQGPQGGNGGGWGGPF